MTMTSGKLGSTMLDAFQVTWLHGGYQRKWPLSGMSVTWRRGPLDSVILKTLLIHLRAQYIISSSTSSSS